MCVKYRIIAKKENANAIQEAKKIEEVRME